MKNFYLSLTVLLFLAFLLLNISNLPAQEEKEFNYPALSKILKYSEDHSNVKEDSYYAIPKVWTINPENCKKELEELVISEEVTEPVEISEPYKLMEETIEEIITYDMKHSEKPVIDLKTGDGVIAINSLPRVLSMYDHNGDGFIGNLEGEDITLNKEGSREMGTFIKNILILPYLKAMGYNTVHFQPITEIGVYGRKGNLGSSFAIKDPFGIDPGLADPLFEGITVEDQYLAFIEAAHALDMKVVQEVIPRTVSVDSKILEDHPEYGYWVIDGCEKRMPDYYSPAYEYVTSEGKKKFPDRESFEKWFYGEYKDKIYGNTYDLADLIDVNQTDPEFAGFFMPSPDVVKREENGRLAGYYYKIDEQGNKIEGEIDETVKAEVLPAFCDTPFEVQPFWQDVTYLKLYEDKKGDMLILTPLSFVTAKFFKDVEPEIEKEYRNLEVWNMITGYFTKFKEMGVDAFVMDMGHALPEDLKKDIKEILPNVWEENLGVNFEFLAGNPLIVTGNTFGYIFPVFYNPTDTKMYEENPETTVTLHIKEINRMVREIAEFDNYEGKMFGSPDNYNTKRVGQSAATRDLTKAPLREGTDIPDFTLAPVDPVMAKRITLLYHTLFRLLSEKGGSPFIFNPVFGNEFVATSTINVGLATHIDEANRFYEYLTPEERENNPEAPKLLLMSKPDRSGGEWTNKDNIIGEIMELNSVIEELNPLLKKNKHMEVIDTGNQEVIFLELTDPEEGGENLAIAANLNLEKENSLELPVEVKEYYLNRPAVGPEEGEKGTMNLSPGKVTVFTY